MSLTTHIMFASYFTLVWVLLVIDMTGRRGIRCGPWIVGAVILGPLAVVPLLFIPTNPTLMEKGLWGG